MSPKYTYKCQSILSGCSKASFPLQHPSFGIERLNGIFMYFLISLSEAVKNE